MRNPPAGSGTALVQKHRIDFRQALFHKRGKFYSPLTQFPAALCDPNGYVVFSTEKAYRESPFLKIGSRVDVRAGISSMPQYKKWPKATRRRSPTRRAITLDWSSCPVVERDTRRLGGAWVFRGTRVPVSALFENLEDGASASQFTQWFRGVTPEQVRAVLGHAARSTAIA